jgi:hypothetical protein
MTNKKSTTVKKENESTLQSTNQLNLIVLSPNQILANTLASLPINLYIDATEYHLLILEQCA